MVSLCKGNLCLSVAELLMVLPRPRSSSFLVPRGNGSWSCVASNGGPPLVSGAVACPGRRTAPLLGGPGRLVVVGALPGGFCGRPARIC